MARTMTQHNNDEDGGVERAKKTMERKISMDNIGELSTLNPQELTLGPVVGNGAFSTVFTAIYKGEKVALKRQAIDAHILRELAILKQIDHPNLLRYIGSCEWDHQGTKELWIVSEFVRGGDICKYIKGRAKLSWKQTVQIALDAANGLNYLHEKRIIHRDIKSANILIDEHFRVRLCDFGFAREVADENNPHHDVSHNQHPFKRERRMSLCGTDAYMPPEMFFEEDYNESADIFSYGIVLMELICRRHINQDGFLMRQPAKNFIIDIEEFKANVPNTCPPSLALLAENCTSFEPSGRPTAREIVEWLEDLQREMTDVDSDSHDEFDQFEVSGVMTDSNHEDDVCSGVLEPHEEEDHFDQESAPTYAGALLMPHGCMRRWRQRYVVIHDSHLTVFKNQKEYQNSLEADNHQASKKSTKSTQLAGAVLKTRKNRRWALVHPNNDLKWEFQATTVQDMQLWIAMLARAIRVADYLDAQSNEVETRQIDTSDEIYCWLESLDLPQHYHTFKDKGFSTLDFIRETGLSEDDFNFLAIEDEKERAVLSKAALVLRGESV